ncbi:MAG: CDP-6-deoxy-delta-3,4-glucoseen reductase [Thiogranum sp.]
MAFSVEIKSSGHRFPVESGETVLAAALRCGVGLPYGCRNGACGTCIATLDSGSVHYPDGEPEALAEEDTDGKLIICQAHPRSDLVISVREVQAENDISIKMLPCRAEQLERLSHDVMLVRLKLPESERLQFLAGQYVEFILKDGRRRAFSIANAPHHDEYLEMHIRHVPGGSFTGHVFEGMRNRALLRIEGPLGSFYLREESRRPILMMAGGTGFAPLKGMLEHAFHIGVDRPVHLFWGVRARRDLYMHDVAREWEKQFPNFTYTPVLSKPDQADRWQGASGQLHETLTGCYPDLGEFDIYMSGPPAMIEAATPALVAQGAHLDHIYSDAFEFAQDVLDKIKQSG